ncbi:pyridoxamine 5'-phosphate oxidase family protein [Saccharophagus degradans]|uniref:2Fe-2S iron-sulfur cluster-binding protein n=1 Tax=Saccharophagus degradans TaxID=86304 RepID=UPI001C090F44|nr:pyridoxamine 5'-phosphate oxidase family protein [Saccharophagus degradans]MBU2986274.1 pyridoxamine 5'-phosphate oxidase family protein [Saccharophagus degradans]
MKRLQPSQFHQAERAVQKRLGVADMVAQHSEGYIRSTMPDQHRDFFTNLPMLIVSITDFDGFPWPIPLHGKPGFIKSPNANTLEIEAYPTLKDVLKLNFKKNQKIGILGIELHTRRRNRMNGTIEEINNNSFSVICEQSFGNCPQYIQKRELHWVETPQKCLQTEDIFLTNTLTSTSAEWIESSDTFFISSRTKRLSTDKRDGLDVSHRGGKPGFVKVENDTLYFPDFSGNKFFNTLGNIQSDSRVGLYFPDYESGKIVLISGTAKIIWDKEITRIFEGAERIISVKVRNCLILDSFLPMRGVLTELSPSLIRTGTWENPQEKSAARVYKQFKIIKKIKESRDVTSFYIRPLDGSALSTYLPGQFLPISIKQPHTSSTCLRTYTLSQAPLSNAYRFSVKREKFGLASRILHDTINTGDSLYVSQPEGIFTLQTNKKTNVFLSAGIGITPMIAMLQGLIREVEKGEKPQDVYFIHSTQNSETHTFSNELKHLNKRHKWLQLYTIYSQPKLNDKLGQHYDVSGRISLDLLRKILPTDNFDVYLCGSESFMRSSYTNLKAMDIAESRIFYEFFDDGSFENHQLNKFQTAQRAEIYFAKSNITATWTPNDGTLLQFAEKMGLKPMYSCRTGNCGTCSCTLSTGEVTYANKPGYAPANGSALICCARPALNTTKLTFHI